jgi:hypothetical protein
VALRDKEGEAAAFHGRFNGACSACPFVAGSSTSNPIASDSTAAMQPNTSSVQLQPASNYFPGNLRNACAHENASSDDTQQRRKRLDFGTEVRCKAVDPNSNSHGRKHDFGGRACNAESIDGNDGPQRKLSYHGRHDAAANGSGGGHHHGEGDVAIGDESAEVARLAAINGADKNHASEHGL